MSSSIPLITDDSLDAWAERQTEQSEDVFAHRLYLEFKRQTGRDVIHEDDQDLCEQIVMKLIYDDINKHDLESLVARGFVTITGVDPETGGLTYRLTPLGEEANASQTENA